MRTVPIGEFSRLTNLSVKTLHHYHEVELLPPAEIDPSTGYRRYTLAQVPQAQLIRRLRDLDMPVPTVREFVTAEAATRDSVLRRHLQHMEDALDHTRQVVGSLKLLLESAHQVDVTYRSVGPQLVLQQVGVVARSDVETWLADAYRQLFSAARSAATTPIGPPGASYAPDYFTQELGEVTAYLAVPTADGAPRDLVSQLAGGRFAVAVHQGGFSDFDRTYGALGAHVTEHNVSLDDPIRETYLISQRDTHDPAEHRTELWWPIADS